jgi:hypothetical protein
MEGNERRPGRRREREATVDCLKLERGLPTKRLIEEIHCHARRGEAARRALAFYLRDMDERREYRSVGCGSTEHFAFAQLSMKARKVRELLRIDRALAQLPAVNAAFGAGELCWSKVREITRVAKPETEDTWLEFGKSHTYKEVENAVAAEKDAQEASKGGLGTRRAKFRVIFDLPEVAHSAFQTALARALNACGKGGDAGRCDQTHRRDGACGGSPGAGRPWSDEGGEIRPVDLHGPSLRESRRRRYLD